MNRTDRLYALVEAVALAVALRRLQGTPFQGSAGSALRKLVAAMQRDDAAAARDLASRIHLVDIPPGAVAQLSLS